SSLLVAVMGGSPISIASGCAPPPHRQSASLLLVQGSAFRRPVDDFDAAVEMFDGGRATLHPIAGIDIGEAAEVAERGAVDVTADDTVNTLPCGFSAQRFLESADEVDRMLHFDFGP